VLGANSDSLELLHYSSVLPPTINTYDGVYYKNLNVRHGLNSNQIKCVLEDHEGNIWLGSFGGGLFKYDGNSLAHFQKKSRMDRFIRALYQDEDHNIWIGTQKGVYVYNGLTLKHLTEKDGLLGGFIMGIAGDESGDIWVGSYPDNFQKFDKKTKKFLASELKHEGFLRNMVDNKRRFWLCTTNGLFYKQSDEQLTQFNFGNDNTNIRFRGVCQDYNGWIWAIGDTNQLFRINPNNLEYKKIELGKTYKPDRFFWISADKRGNIYIGLVNNGLIIYNTKSGESRQIFKNFQFNGAIIDDYHTIWLADKSNGLIWMPETPFENFDIGTTRGAFGLVKSGSELYYGSFNQQISKLKLNSDPVVWESEINKPTTFHCSFYINDNHFYIGTKYGLIQFKDGKSKLFDSMSRIRCIKRMNNHLLIGTQYGLVKFDLSNEKVIQSEEFLKHDFNYYVNHIAINNENDWWLATDVHGIIRIKDGEIIQHLTHDDGLCHNHTISISLDRNKDLWIGTNDGLSIYKDSKFLNFSSDDGLSHDYIHTLILDSAGEMWAGTEHGINRIELNDDQIIVKQYGINEGFLGNDCAQNSIFIEPDNTMWWGTGAKVSKYDPLLDQEDLIPPNVRIDRVLIHFYDVHHHNKNNNSDGIKYSKISKWNNLPLDLELDHFMNHVNFKFLSIDWKTPNKLLYQFKLEGFEDEWSPPDKKQEVTYSNLPAGEYNFLVKARNDDGYWSEPKSFSFTVHPPWWKTVFARIVFSIMILLMLISYINLRTKNLKAKQKELENIVRQRTNEIKLQKDEIETQKVLVDIKNKEITDSVKYASRIQRALLQPEDHVDQLMPEHFIFFKPRNIVSGDFYWANRQNDSIFVCAADCTGHGVPGAMLSMLGISFLNQIVHGNDKILPSQVLDELKKQIIKELSQKGMDEDSKDGIDAGMIKIERNKISYSGANNSLYLIRDSADEAPVKESKSINNEFKTLYEIRGDKQPIGYHPNKDWEFHNHAFEAKDGDLLFLFSDGFPDQFGGVKGKKFKYAPFKEFLLSISDLSVSEQKSKMHRMFKEWKGDFEQVDDILVIGMKFSKTS
jgi:ligand-binding sensor domain-containing protein/serine phosphatase RsbU (regulator of sigma subunit)